MNTLNLASFIALVQGEIQQSFEFSENMSKIGRESDHSDVRIGLAEAEVEMPFQYMVDEAEVDIEEIKAMVQNGSQIDIAKYLLDRPRLDANVVFALKDRMTLDSFELQEDGERLEEKANAPTRNGKVRAEKATLTRLEALNDVHEKRVSKIDWVSLKQKSNERVSVVSPSPEKAHGDFEQLLTGRIKMRFRPVTKV